jgi:very-short-patch-repair endonuclease
MTRRTREIGFSGLVLAAREMRGEPTRAELILWQMLRRRGLGDARFRRQYAIGPYILDFFCLELGLAVEVDGKGHEEPDQVRYDQERTDFLNRKGIAVLRFSDNQVENELDRVLESLLKVVKVRQTG